MKRIKKPIIHFHEGCGWAWAGRDATADVSAVTCKRCKVTRRYYQVATRAGLSVPRPTWPAGKSIKICDQIAAIAELNRMEGIC